MATSKKTGVAVLECLQMIPCNPCTSACKVGAITKETLTSLPVIDTEKCIGCRMCVAACPGQAIFFIEDDGEKGTALITFPYEYRPLPEIGQEVTAVDRKGQPVTEGFVRRVDVRGSFNLTTLVTVEVPEKYRDDVRFIKRLKAGEAAKE